MGKEPKPPQRTAIISVWYFPEEREEIREAARVSEVSISHFIRSVALKKARRVLGGRKCEGCGTRS